MNEFSDSDEEALDGEVKVGSLKHGTIQSNIAGALKYKSNKKIHAVTELSLDISNFDLRKYDLKAKTELEPDISGYFVVPEIPEEDDDLIRVTRMPDLAIEILSPGQSLSYLQRKIRALFAMGVRSCWLVMPSLNSLWVFSAPDIFKNFDLGDEEVIDEKLEIHLPMKEIFEL